MFRPRETRVLAPPNSCFFPQNREFRSTKQAVLPHKTPCSAAPNTPFAAAKLPVWWPQNSSSAARPEGAGPMRPVPPPHIRSSAAPRPAPRSRGARPAMAPVGERLAAAVARAIEGHDCTRRAPQVRPWRATAADKASSARTRLELHERSSSQPVRAKKPPPPSAQARATRQHVSTAAVAPPPLRPSAARAARALPPPPPPLRLACSPPPPRFPAPPRFPPRLTRPAQTALRQRRSSDRGGGRCSAPPPLRVSPDAAPSATPSPDTGHWWRCTSASPPSPPAPRPRSAAGAARAPRPRPPPRPLRLSSSGSDVSRGGKSM